MITLLPIALALLLAPPALDDDPQAPPPPRADRGHLSGRVTYDGPLPPAVLNPEAGTRRPPVEVDPRSRGLREAAVWIDRASLPEAALNSPAPEADDEDDPEPIEVDQLNYEFIPRVLTVEAGRPVAFLNSDIANHGVTAGGPAVENRFNVTTPPGGRYLHRFAPSRQPVALGCPIHAAMSGWIFVLDHPHHAVTDDLGRFLLADLPPGPLTLIVHHPAGGLRRRVPVEVRAGETTELEIPFAEDDLRPPPRHP